ncbi:hypothetical protein DFH09DRAFT_1341870 [Mycena vulgaris]|nr:hypothetical protein DFH09DRAFT_1341870 [Mycena vulgaris]
MATALSADRVKRDEQSTYDTPSPRPLLPFITFDVLRTRSASASASAVPHPLSHPLSHPSRTHIPHPHPPRLTTRRRANPRLTSHAAIALVLRGVRTFDSARTLLLHVRPAPSPCAPPCAAHHAHLCAHPPRAHPHLGIPPSCGARSECSAARAYAYAYNAQPRCGTSASAATGAGGGRRVHRMGGRSIRIREATPQGSPI